MSNKQDPKNPGHSSDGSETINPAMSPDFTNESPIDVSTDCGCGCGGCDDKSVDASDCVDCKDKVAGCTGCASEDNSKDEFGNPVKLVKEFTAETNAILIAAAAAAASGGEGFDGNIDTGDAAAPTRPVPPTDSQPGKWVPLPKQESVDVDTARKYIEGRQLPTNIYDPAAVNQAPAPTVPGIKSLATGFAGNTVAGPASIVELSRALKSNVDLIYEWVFNNVENLPSFGIQKGGLGAVIDGLGNSFDQADLMIKLLRQAGYTANYQFGTLRMTGAQAGAWLGTDPANVWAANNLLANSGVPTSVVNISGVDGVEFSHCWVLCNIGGTNYVFDPVQKTYTTKTKINLATAMGYTAATFLTRAKTGATVTADYVQNMNRANIRADLATMTGNLVNWIKTNNHAAGMDDILGGRNIVQYDAATPLRQTVHPFKKAGTTPTTWTSVPQAYKATMHTVYDTIDITFNTEDLAGKRLTLTFNGTLQGELRLDGTLLGTSTAQGVGTWNSVLFDIVHPYASWFADQYVWQQVWAGKPYLLCNSWGNLTPSSTKVHGPKLAELRASNASTTGEPVLGETMAQMWKTMDTMTSRMADITNRMSNCTTVMHHACGLIGWFDTAFCDIGAVTWGTSALDNNYNQQQANDTALAMHGVALEAQIVREYQTVLGVSATPIIDKANTAGQKIYDAKTANWLGTVKPALINYAAGDKTNIENWYINNGYRVGLPENGQNTIVNWTGLGYYAIPSYGTFGIIGGGLKGGSAAQAVPLSQMQYLRTEMNYDIYLIPDDFPRTGCIAPLNTYNASTCIDVSLGGISACACWFPAAGFGPGGWGLSSPSSASANGGGGSVGNGFGGQPTSNEPIGLYTGSYLLDETDITVGSAAFPYGLSFSRTYNSAMRNQHGPLGRGWRHNHMINAGIDTDGLSGMGEQTTIGAAGTIVEAFVAYDLQTDLTKPFDKYITTALMNQWFVDNLSNNTVTIGSGFDSQTFVKLPDGTYANPALDAGTLTLVGGLFTYKSLTGLQLNFNSYGHIATMVYPAGVTVTYTYDSMSRLSTVSNGLGRTLTLTYGANNFLSSVTDGTGRSVGYTIDSNGNLTTVTDPNSKNWTYEYDIPGRMIKLFKPANPTAPVATNAYDTLGRVKEQRDSDNNLWQYYFAGSRTEEKNPNGKSTVLYYTNLGKVSKSINQLGKKVTFSYDGRGRTTKTTLSEGNGLEIVYNSKNLPITLTTKPKPGSGLTDIVTSATYDTVWNKLKTSTDAMGRVSTQNYDATTGNLLSSITPAVTGVGAAQITLTYNSRGQILTITEPTGIVTKNTYDSTTEKLLTTVRDFGSGRLNLTTSFGYDSVGNTTSIQNPRGNSIGMVFDAARRLTQITAPSPYSYLTKFTYDDNGSQIKVERQTGDVANPWQTWLSTYCPCGAIWTLTNPLGHTTTFDYDSIHRLWKTTDAAGRVVTRLYDDANRILTVSDPSGTVNQTFTYTDNGLCSSVKDARNYVTSFTFDGFDRGNKTIHPNGTFEQRLNYNANGRPATIVSRKDHPSAPVHRFKTDFTYDEANRVKTKVVTNDGVVTTTTMTYDLAGRITNVNLSGAGFGTGNYQYFYDTVGRFYKEQYPDSKAVVHVLDANGNITKTTYPDGTYFVERVYDQLDRLTDIKLNGAVTSAVQFQYDQLSRRKKLIYENGTTTDYGLNYDDNVSNVAQSFVGSSVTFAYGFDLVGQINSQNVSDSQFMWHPAAAGTSTYGTANNLNQYGTVGGIAQVYDSNGCLTNDGSFTYVFNAENMLTQVKNAAGTTVVSSYLYDPMLRQVQKTVGAAKTNFYYAGFQRLADYDGTALSLQNRYVYGTGTDEILIQVSSAGTKTYYHHNNQSSVIATTNASGAVVNRYKYGPFGESASLSGTTHGFTGQRYDSETGLYYYKMRYYSPRLGRFLQPDPIGLTGGLNNLAYTANSPLRMMDSMGTETNDMSLREGGGPKEMQEEIFRNCVTTLCDIETDGWVAAMTNFVYKVLPGGIWDYKRGREGHERQSLANFGNFNFGANMRALGFDPETTKAAAGLANLGNATAANLIALLTLHRPTASLGADATMMTYFDQPLDQQYVAAGYNNASSNIDYLKKRCAAECRFRLADAGRNTNYQIGKNYGTTFWETRDQYGTVIGTFETFTGGLFVIGFDYGNWGYQGPGSSAGAPAAGSNSGAGGSK